ncbi:DUF6178 family protein [Desulfococcaceae bacterium HSG7]|nr:DUF6178 family protein [Desulfococcaceae bacterium HSG7]
MMHANGDSITPTVAAQIALIHKERLELLAMSGDEALERILNARNPAALVHALPAEYFYFLINDIGIHDALPLLSLGAFHQWEYILDIELWDKERLSPYTGLYQIDALLKADPQRYLKWTLENHISLFELLLFKNIEVYLREPGFDPNDLYDDLFTVDDVFYVRFKPPQSMRHLDNDEDEDSGNVESPELILRNLMEQLATYDYAQYQQVLLESASVIPAEVEEEAYRLRNVRLAEKGFLPYDEAIGVYQPLHPQEIDFSCKKYFGKNRPSEIRTSVSQSELKGPLKLIETSNLFADALLTIDAEHILNELQSEFAGLCNLIAVADQEKIKNRKLLQQIVTKTGAYLNIGLEYLSEYNQSSHQTDRLSRFRKLIIKIPLSQIFRVGYGKVLELKWKAQKWQSNSWFDNAGLALTFWDEAWLGVLGGLLIRRPLFFDNYRTGKLYREFNDIDDIKATEVVLNQIMAIDALFSEMALPLPPRTDVLLTWKNYLLTLWAQHFLGLDDHSLQPLSAAQLDRLLKAFRLDWKKSLKTDEKTRRSLRNWLINKLSDEKSAFPMTDSNSIQAQLLDELLDTVKDEYSRIAAKDIDSRYVHLFVTDM